MSKPSYNFESEIEDPYRRAFYVRKKVVDTAVKFVENFEKMIESGEPIDPAVFQQYESCCNILQKASINKEFSDKHENKSLNLTGDITSSLVRMAEDRDAQVRKMLLDNRKPVEKIEDAEIVEK